MATNEASGPVNGSYAPQGYDNSYATGASNFTPSQQPTSQPAQQAPASEIPKDEVGWYFVEQYYTTLSKSPDRLYVSHLQLGKAIRRHETDPIAAFLQQALPVRLRCRRGQGQRLLRPEGMLRKANGRHIELTNMQAINERIKELDFKDTKVRVTNVDSQGSDANIVIQVIGEISNQGQPHKRFVQTFVLAEQTNGYFVLNDIFRYLAEEPEEEEEPQQELAASANGAQEPAATEQTESLTRDTEVATSEEDLSKVNQKLEEVAKEEPATEEVTPAASTEVESEETEHSQAQEAPAAAVEDTSSKDLETPAVSEAIEAEKPKAPAPSPAPPATKAAPVAMPAGPPKPAAPRTWASLAASAHKVATPVVAAPAAQQVPPSQPKAAAAAAAPAAPTQPTTATPAQTSAPARDQSPATSQGETAGWQSVTGHKKEQSRAVNQGPVVDADQKRAYIKNVYSQVEEGALKAALTKYGEIEYLDISRPKVSIYSPAIWKQC